jgi:hypothetical protein
MPSVGETSLICQPTVMFNVRRERGCLLAPRAISMENAMKRIATLTPTVGLMLFLGLVLPGGDAVGQQQAGPTLHRYLVQAELTAEGIRNLQKQP